MCRNSGSASPSVQPFNRTLPFNPPTTMAPTKQTAKKTTGGKAQRIRLFKDRVREVSPLETCSANTVSLNSLSVCT